MSTLAKSEGVAYSGSRPGQYPQTSIFDFAFSNPFENESDYVPASRKVPHVDDSHPVFIDHKTGKIRSAPQMIFR